MRMCSKSGCNTENVIQSECVSCKSAFNGKCAIISDTDIDTYIKKCEGTYSHEKRGCYTMLKSERIHSQFVFTMQISKSSINHFLIVSF